MPGAGCSSCGSGCGERRAPDDELLAGIALGDEDATARQAHHLDGCATCSANLAELRQLSEQVGEADPSEILAPGQGLLGRIHAELLSTSPV